VSIPAYLDLARTGELERRAEALAALQSPCRLCARLCGARRREGQLGECRAGVEMVVASAFPHFGEEPPLTGQRGSGTIFLAHCNLHCVFCQNFDISHLDRGEAASVRQVADLMLSLQREGCHNINFVTPTHYSPQIVSAVADAAQRGLELPLVWNCGGYESVEALRLLDGIVDIYMPDLKFMTAESGERYAHAADYPEAVRAAVLEMKRQVGDLQIDGRGIARRGLLVRHLVMPGGEKDTEGVLRFVAEEFGRESYINIMDQYRPMWRAMEYPELARPLTGAEWERAASLARSLGLRRGF